MGDAAFCAQCAALTGGASTSEELDALRARLIEDGYLTTAPSAELAAAVSLKAVREGMRRLVAAGWPATLILLYDEAWVIAHHYGALVSAACGGANVMSFDMLAWLIVPSEGHAGFAPHRDRQPSDVRGSFHGDGSPKYCTAWVALGDADPDTSCLYLVRARVRVRALLRLGLFSPLLLLPHLLGARLQVLLALALALEHLLRGLGKG